MNYCNAIVPANGSFMGFTNCKNCSCATCDMACEAPDVSSAIGFFDGFDGILVAIVYAALIIFSVLF